MASEIRRGFKLGGVIMYYDLRINNPFNKNIIGINKKEIDNNLFPFTSANQNFRIKTFIVFFNDSLINHTSVYSEIIIEKF